MAKLKKLQTKNIRAEAFDGVRSFGAALWAIEICNHLITRHNAGDLVFSYENIIVPTAELRFNNSGEFDGLYLMDSDNSSVQLVGDIRNQHDKICCTKADIREFFKLWRVAQIRNVSKVTDLTK